jgi:hypothetical protein
MQPGIAGVSGVLRRHLATGALQNPVISASRGSQRHEKAHWSDSAKADPDRRLEQRRATMRYFTRVDLVQNDRFVRPTSSPTGVRRNSASLPMPFSRKFPTKSRERFARKTGVVQTELT